MKKLTYIFILIVSTSFSFLECGKIILNQFKTDVDITATAPFTREFEKDIIHENDHVLTEFEQDTEDNDQFIAGPFTLSFWKHGKREMLCDVKMEKRDVDTYSIFIEKISSQHSSGENFSFAGAGTSKELIGVVKNLTEATDLYLKISYQSTAPDSLLIQLDKVSDEATIIPTLTTSDLSAIFGSAEKQLTF